MWLLLSVTCTHACYGAQIQLMYNNTKAMAIQGNTRGYMACRYITTQVSGAAWWAGSVL